MRIGEVLNGVYDKSVGWRPATGSIKPVHIANGLFRDMMGGEVHDVESLLSFIVPWKKKETREPHPQRSYQYLVHDIKDPRYSAFRDENYRDYFERLREFVRGLLAADGAVFPQAKITSFSLTCRQMITTDLMDKEVGRFMAQIIRGEDGDGPLAKLIVDCLKKDSDDPITFLVSPLLSRDWKLISTKSDRCSPYDNKNLKGFSDLLEVAAKQLAEHEHQQGNRLATLQRVVHFSCLALLAHAQALSAEGKLKNRVPLLLTMETPKGSSLARASEDSLITFYENFEDWLAKQIALRISDKKPLVYESEDDGKKEGLGPLPDRDKRTVRKYLSQISTYKGESADRDLMDNRMSLYEQSLSRYPSKRKISDIDDSQWVLILGETIVQCYLNEYTSGGPREFLGGIGRKAGIIFPHFQGRSREKRVRPSVPILDLLVRSCCPINEPIPLHQFLDRVWERFGIIVGGRLNEQSGDHELLTENRIDVSQTDLEENTTAFVDNLVRIGLARRYPDNIAYVGKYHV